MKLRDNLIKLQVQSVTQAKKKYGNCKQILTQWKQWMFTW